jgi:branched-chain amino acid transport system permease protein
VSPRERVWDQAGNAGARALTRELGAAGMISPGRTVALVLFVAAGLCPLVLDEFKTGLIGLGLTYGLFAVGLDVAWGRAGLISIGQAVFFGFGCYGVAVAEATNRSGILGGAIGVALAILFGAFIAVVGLRRGTNPSTMAVLTLVTTLLAEKVARSWWAVTGGSSGIFVAPPDSTAEYYWICFVAMTAVVGSLWFFVLNRPLGNRFTAIQLNDQRAEHLGIPVYRGRVIAFAIGAAISAVAGGLAAPWMGSVSPSAVGIVFSTQVLVWVAVGGRATILGPFLGAVAATYGQDVLASTLGDSYLLLLGVLFIISVLLMPNGVVGLLRSGPQLADTTPREAAALRPAWRGGAAVLEARGIVKRFAGNTVLDGVDLVVRPGEIVCLIGPNGAGKSTLLNVLTGALASNAGTVALRGVQVETAPPHERVAAGLARTFQVPSLFPGLTTTEHLILARQEAGAVVPLPLSYQRLEQEHGADRVELLPLSGRRSLETAMALCSRPDVLLLDEPAAGLARNEAGALAKTLRSLRDQVGCAILCVEHDMEIVRDLADRVVCLHHGRVISEGSMDEVSANAQVRRAYLGLA